MKTIRVLLVLISSLICACQQHTQNVKEQTSMPAEMIRIPGGSIDVFGNGTVMTVDTFYMDKHLVTYEQYNQFIKAGGYEEMQYWSEEGRNFLERYQYTVPSTYPKALPNPISATPSNSENTLFPT